MTCFGSPGYIYQWANVASYRTAQERDAAFDKFYHPDVGKYRRFDYDPIMLRVT